MSEPAQKCEKYFKLLKQKYILKLFISFEIKH